MAIWKHFQRGLPVSIKTKANVRGHIPKMALYGQGNNFRLRQIIIALTNGVINIIMETVMGA
jgi:hypothetical protein